MNLTRSSRIPVGRHNSRGFTLIEIVVVLTILALIIGATVPTIQTARNIQARRSTVAELEELGRASLEYARDFGVVPTSTEVLLTDPGDAAWAGPYLGLSMDDQWSGLGGWSVDGWSNPYTFTVAGSLLTLTSFGPDQAAGGGDDLALDVNPAPVWRQETQRRLEIINRAIALYNSAFLAVDPLPTDWTLALNKLVSRGYLPAGAPQFATDAFGDPYQADPPGALPVVQASSIHL